MIKDRILVVDDEDSIREFLTILLEKEGYDVATADSVGTGIERLHSEPFDLVMCDLKLPDGNGLQVLEEARRRQLQSPFIIITAHTTPQHAVESLRAGAAEYLSKPFNVEDLKIILDKLLRRGGDLPFEVPEFIGSSPPIQRILDLIPRVAATPSTVLITGESGTGKELRGSFTGAVRDHTGLFQQATEGTIFLDEIGELTPPTQVKLLRVLQEHRVRPVGGQKEVDVNVRVLAATNRDLQKDVESGVFREDLYYRLNVLHLHLPSLRHRGDDVPELARHFVVRTCERFDLAEKRLTPDAVRVLQAYPWPGNVRELENVIEQTVALEQSEIISSGSLPEHLRGAPDGTPHEHISLPEEGVDLEEYLNDLRLSMMRQALDRTGGHQKRAAELLRLSYRAFRYHADKLGLIRDEETSQ
jgi:DNA-binding NtrC family response regulator